MGWPEVLDDMERRLDDVDRELSSGGPAVAPFALPDDLGPLPVDLRERARRALTETRARQTEVEAARDRVAAALRQSRTVPREPAAYLDTWA
jgi:hypothetical protein